MREYTKEEEFQMLLKGRNSLMAAKERTMRESLELQQQLLDKIAELQQQLEEEKKRCNEEVKLIDASLVVHVAQLKRDYNYPPEQPKKVIHHDESWWHEDDSDK